MSTEQLIAADRGAAGRRRSLGVASIAVLLAAADTYVVVLALPDMMAGVGLGIDQLQRATPILSAFLLGYVVTLPLIGRLADLRGCRPVLVGCLLLFAVGCLLTATSTDLGPLVAGRTLQGVGGGGLVPATLALVAQTWPAERRGLPLGVVGAVQEAGATIGPLVGAAILALASWRAIFWSNLVAALVLAVALIADRSGVAVERDADGTAGAAGTPGAERASGLTWFARLLGAIAVLVLAVFLIAPARLVEGVTSGEAWIPVAGDQRWTAPLALVAIGLGVLALALWAAGSRAGALLRQVDAVGSVLLAGALAGLVLTFSTADPQTSVLASKAPVLLTVAVLLAAGFVFRQRTAGAPLVPRGTLRPPAAWGALLINLLVGAALVAALVDIPVFALNTSQHGQLGAALELVRLLIAVPAGALAGGWAIRRVPTGVICAAGLALTALGLLAMTRWGDHTLTGVGGTPELLLAGLGFGLAIAPVNAALLAVTGAEVHGLASALAVVARMIGMLAGLSVLTAVGLRVFYRAQHRIGTILQLCPTTPTHCPAYTKATHAALLSELHTIFGGAALSAAAAAVLGLLLLPRRRAAVRP